MCMYVYTFVCAHLGAMQKHSMLFMQCTVPRSHWPYIELSLGTSASTSSLGYK